MKYNTTTVMERCQKELNTHIYASIDVSQEINTMGLANIADPIQSSTIKNAHMFDIDIIPNYHDRSITGRLTSFFINHDEEPIYEFIYDVGDDWYHIVVDIHFRNTILEIIQYAKDFMNKKYREFLCDVLYIKDEKITVDDLIKLEIKDDEPPVQDLDNIMTSDKYYMQRNARFISHMHEINISDINTDPEAKSAKINMLLDRILRILMRKDCFTGDTILYITYTTYMAGNTEPIEIYQCFETQRIFNVKSLVTLTQHNDLLVVPPTVIPYEDQFRDNISTQIRDCTYKTLQFMNKLTSSTVHAQILYDAYNIDKVEDKEEKGGFKYV